MGRPEDDANKWVLGHYSNICTLCTCRGVMVCFVAATLQLIGSSESCQPYSLECKKITKQPYNYTCSAPAPVYGDSCTEINVPKGICGSILNVSVTENVEANWTDTNINITVWFELQVPKYKYLTYKIHFHRPLKAYTVLTMMLCWMYRVRTISLFMLLSTWYDLVSLCILLYELVQTGFHLVAVSYTHLTLPTILRV